MDFKDHIELVKDYIEDSMDFLDEMENLFLELERQVGQKPDNGSISEILSILHTFKGNSGMMGFGAFQKYTHKLEDLFKALQSGASIFDASFVEFCMQCISALRGAISGISLKNPVEPEFVEAIVKLDKFIKATVDSPVLSDTVPVQVSKDTVHPLSKKSTVIKVDFERLDNLINLMGELVIHRTRLGQIEARFIEEFGDKGLVVELSDTFEHIGKVSTELHEAIMKVRMLPLKRVFMRFPRFVRDAAKEMGKEINIQFEGEETELDKKVIDEIGEPLMHLIRNAMDHGLEMPTERQEKGKPSQGTILIRAYQESSHIVINVEDDGRGINREYLLEKAIQSGLWGKDDPGNDLSDLIFQPGLSTAKTVTETSGRGLGMEVVQKSLAKINGSIEVVSHLNAGTRFTIKLPLTLAIISTLMVEASGEQYAIPLASVIESIKVDSGEVHEVNHREVIKVRDKILPLARLSTLFGVPHATNGGKLYIVIVRGTTGQVGLIVDALKGRQEIVIKPLDESLGAPRGIAGATILGDGRVVLIVDIPTLTGSLKHRRENTEAREVEHA